LREKLFLEEQRDCEDLTELIPADSEDAALVGERLLVAYSEYGVLHLQIAAIDEAIVRIDSKTFGLCIECEEIISFARLTAIPYTCYCMECQLEVESKEKRLN
jgi:RNA polymerase-binding transcription factor DksA